MKRRCSQSVLSHGRFRSRVLSILRTRVGGQLCSIPVFPRLQEDQGVVELPVSTAQGSGSRLLCLEEARESTTQ